MSGSIRAKEATALTLAGTETSGDGSARRLRPERPSVPVSSGPKRATREPPSVLLVDDDPAVLRAVGRSLRSRGYVVVTAQDGEEAAKQIGENTFDVILITGEPAVRTAVQALEYGAFHYLTKPIGTDSLEAVLEKAVRMHRMARLKQQAAELLGN